MHAAVYYETGPPDVLRYEEVPDPECFPGAVVVQVEAISIEGGDTLNRLGGDMPAVPHVVGYQCAGTIIEVGEGVADRHVGQRVVANSFWGSHAERFVTLALMTWPIPEGADVVACACVPVAFGTAHDCLFEFGRLQAGETVLIQAGAGGVGTAAIQLAKRAGATVIATASSRARLDRLTELGMDHGVNYTEDGWIDAVRAASGGWGVHVAVDPVGGATLQGSIACLGPRGRAISVGSAGRDPRLLDISDLAPRTGRSPACSSARRSPPTACSSWWGISSTTSPPDGCGSWWTAPSRSPRPLPRTPTSRAARPSAASC